MLAEDSNATDRRLLQGIKEGDESSFEVLYLKYARLVFRLVRKNISSKEDSEEITQEIFESIWTRRAEIGYIVDFKHYIMRAAKYKVIRYIQRMGVKRRYDAHYRAFEVAFDTIPEGQRTPEQINEQMLTYIRMLPARCQAAIRMRILEHLSNEEIAKRMNISKKAVKNYMVVAFSHLRSYYDQIYKVG